MKTKKCTKCGIEKPLTEFHKRSSSKDGHASQCKSCVAKYYAQHHAKNKEKKLKQMAEYYAKNKEKISKKTAEYYTQNKEKILKRKAEHHSLPDVKERKAKYRSKRKSEQPNCIYQIDNSINGRIYIGETTRGELRWKGHLRRLRGNYHPNKPLQEDFNKYGEEAFEWEILEEFESDDKDALILEEARTIQRYIQDGVDLYNVQLSIAQLKMLEEDKKSQ